MALKQNGESPGRGIEVMGVAKVFARRGPDKRQHAFRVLDDISLRIDTHEFVAIIGPSGCGKTTLLRIVAGLMRQDAGTVLVDGKAVSGPGVERAVVFQQPALLPWADVLTNIAFGLKLRGVDLQMRIRRARELVELVGLDGFERSLPGQLSGGMQQRVGLARALAVDPRYLLMDEPFGSLDEITRRGMQAELVRIWARQEKAAMFITHNVEEAVILSDRVVVMGSQPGRVVADIPVDLPRPRSHDQERTAEFQSIRDRVWDVITTWSDTGQRVEG